MKTPPMPSLHDRIINLQINIPPDVKQGAELEFFRRGQGTAILAAAALASEADGTIKELTEALRRIAHAYTEALEDYEIEAYLKEIAFSALARAAGTDTGK